MNNKRMLLISICALSLFSCDSRSTIQKETDELNNYLRSFLGSKPDEFFQTLKISSRVFSDDWSKATFQFKETRDDGVDVYTCGSKNGLETQFYYRNDMAVGLRTRDPQFGLTIYGYYPGYPVYSPYENYDSLFDALENHGFKIETGLIEHEIDQNENYIRYPWCSAVFEEKLHISFSWNELYSVGGSLHTMEVILDV